MTKINLSDQELFGNDAGEDENPEVLDSYFIDLEDFNNFTSLEVKNCIISARKGMGKSALISKFAYSLKEAERKGDVVVIKITGNSLQGLCDSQGKDSTYYENIWKQIICKKISIEIGKKIGFAISNDQMSMVEAAEIEGIKNKNIIGALISRISGKIPALDIEIKEKLPQNWEAQIKQYQEKYESSTVWLLVDDIDSRYIDNEEHQNRIGSFFTATRNLVNEVKNLKIRSTVRSDVWSNLRHLEDLDKCEQYKIEINWSKKHLRDMLAKRISAYVKRKHPNSNWIKYDYKKDPYQLFNLVFTNKITWGNQSSDSFEPIRILAAGRPRWMGQLCRMAANQAYKNRSRLVGINQINDVMNEFGKFRKNDLIKEHKHQFNDLDKLIDAFRAKSKEYDVDGIDKVLMQYALKKGYDKIPTIDGENFVSTHQLGAFLYKIGFISGIGNSNQDFINYIEDPDLYNSSANTDNRLKWAIHPSYRKYLNLK